MSNVVDRHARVRLASQWIEVDGQPVLPVTGELHYSRVPRARWEEALRLLRASGVTVVSTYVFWIHHEPVRGEAGFDGDLDVAAFVEMAGKVGLDVIVRLGPWCHGEVRGGGLPDWVLEAAPRTRRDDPAYLGLVRDWFGAVGEQLAESVGPSGPVIGIQIENELYDQPGHIATLKQMARDAGLSAPIWTATAWGGALLPAHEVFPLYGGYADGFWVDQGEGWHDSFRDHFRFTHVWDDPGVGGDRRDPEQTVEIRDLDPEFPPATCELGGGMATAYHRRPVLRGKDVAALANVKLGNGSVWQGFYMYVGGINPRDGLQESHATGYPNDLPRFDYDFQAPISATGRSGPGLALLRDHNAFVASFGGRLVRMRSTLPDDAPVAGRDLDTLRWAVRTDGSEGFLFINTHQPHEPLSPVPGVQLRVGFDDGELVVPDRPVDLPSGLVARWPLRLDIAGVRIDWATASAVSLVDGPVPTLVLRAHAGVSPRAQFAGEEPVDLPVGAVIVACGTLRVLTVEEAQADRLWHLDGQLIDADCEVWLEGGFLVARSESRPAISRWSGEAFEPIVREPDAAASVAPLGVERIRGAGEPPARYGEFMGRSSAPDDAQVDALAAVWRLTTPPPAVTGQRIELVIDWEGDVAQLRADGALVGDRFWDGRAWRVDVTELDPAAELTLHILPVTSRSVIDFDPSVRSQVDADHTLCDALSVTRVASVLWREPA